MASDMILSEANLLVMKDEPSRQRRYADKQMKLSLRMLPDGVQLCALVSIIHSIVSDLIVIERIHGIARNMTQLTSEFLI